MDSQELSETQSIKEPDNNSVSGYSQPGIHKISIDGVTLNYEVSGDGEPLIIMHGWGCNLNTVKSIADLASKAYKVYNLDLPGFGESSEPNECWGIEKYTQFVEKFIKSLQIESPIIIGHSFGGRIGILLSSRNQVKKLILVDSAGVKPRRPLRYYLKVYGFKTAKTALKLLLPKKIADRKISEMRNKRGSADYNSSTPMMKAILSRVVNEDLKFAMPSIEAPTLLIWGEKDQATPVNDAKIMEKLIPNAGLVVFDGAGHYSFLDNPFGFKAVLSSFLEIK